MNDDPPTHLVRRSEPSHVNPAGKLVSLCGAKGKGSGPRVGVEHAQAHIDGRGMVPCPDCVAVLDSKPRQLVLEVAS